MQEGELKDMLQLLEEKKQAQRIIAGIEAEGNVLIFASDGVGVRPVNELLSEEKVMEVNKKIIEYMNQLISDINDEIYDYHYQIANNMNPPEEGYESELEEKD